MNGNRYQLQGPGGYTPSLTATTGPGTFFFNLRGLPTKAGNDYLYADCIRVRVWGPIHLLADQSGGAEGIRSLMPNQQQAANIVRQCRVFAPLLGELFPRRATYGTFLVNHDRWLARRFRRTVPEQVRNAVATAASVATMYVDIEFPFDRDYGISPDDFTPLMALLEGGQLEVDLAPTTALTGTGLNTNGAAGAVANPWVLGTGANAWQARASIHYHHDSQLFLHVPTQFRLYEQVLSAPSFELQNVGAAQGLDGVISGARLAAMSWLGAGYGIGEAGGAPIIDANQFYTNAPVGSGVNFAQQGLQRMDVPWRDQRSVIDVQSWIHDFMLDIKRVALQQQVDAGTVLTQEWANGLTVCDQSGFPFDEDVNFGTALGDPLLTPALGMWPLVWPGAEGAKIADMMMVDGTLQFNADFATSPSSRAHRFRTDEVTMFTPTKIQDLMDALQVPHVDRGGAYVNLPKYDTSRLGSARTAAFLPQKIVPKSAVT